VHALEVSAGREEGSGATDSQGMSAKMSRLQADALHEPLGPIAQLVNRDGPTGAKTEERLKLKHTAAMGRRAPSRSRVARLPQPAAAGGVGRHVGGGRDASSLRTLQPASKDAAIKPRTSVLQGAGVRALLSLKASDDGGSERDKEGEQG